MKLQSALHLAGLGFRVFPIASNSKAPEFKGWKEDATTDPVRVERWWTEDPERNIGIAAGHGVVIVDADTKDERPGLDSLAMLDMCGLPDSFRVATPSGGVHVYLATQHKHRNRVDTIPDHPGIDIRSDGGYVLGPGSTIDGKAYSVAGNPTSVAPAPQWFDDLLLKDAPRTTPKSEIPLVDLDKPENIARATEWLMKTAPEAIEGAGGDDTTYRVATRLRDLGVSQDTALELLLEHWNEDKASPPWSPDDLARKVENAFQYATGGWGAHTAAAEFGALDDIDIGEPPRPANKQDDFLEPEKKADMGFPVTRASTAIGKKLPPRQWLYGYMLSRKYVSVLASPGGVGKTAFTFAAAMAMASGDPHLHDQPHKPLRVWLYNLEDDITELERRVQALATHLDASPSVLDNIILSSGRDRPLKLAAMKDGHAVATPDAKKLVDALLANKVDVLVLDPLVNAHTIPENDIDATAILMEIVAKIADRANCAIWLVHHTRKGFVAGDADSVRGGSSLVANSRGAYTLAPMAVEEAKLYGVPEDMRKRYVKLDDAKANMSVSSGRARWMHLQSVALGNGDAEYPTGDSVQVVVKWSPPQALDGMEQSDIRTMLEAVEAGAGDGERFSIRTQDKDRWAGQMLVDEFGKTPEQAKAFLKTASEKGWITTEEYTSPTQRKVRKGLFVHLAKLPEEALAEIE